MDRGNSAGQIYIFNRAESRQAHQFNKLLLIWKLRYRVGQIFIRPLRAAHDPTDAWQNFCEVKIEKAAKTGNDRTREFQHRQFAAGLQYSAELDKPIFEVRQIPQTKRYRDCVE